MQLYNTRTRKIEQFKPINGNQVLMYSCGPTVYDYQHIGNFLAYVYWDVLVRTLGASGFDVRRVMNLTDVGHLVSDADEGEDKLEKGARREGKTAWQVAKFYGDDFIETFDELGLLRPVKFAKATDYIEQQLALMRELKSKGFSYQIDDGIYFDSSKFTSYAEFAQLDVAGLKAGARIAYDTQKRNPTDFALWKFSPSGSQRDMEWNTPSDLLEGAQPRKGFPGWHLECSAIVSTELGETIDIHTGGIDHIPVHHTNEIAQSEAATGKQFVNVWLHNNHLLVDGKKIAKSAGNSSLLSDIKKHGHTLDDFRLFVIEGHYRSQRNFTWDGLAAAAARLKRWKIIAVMRHQLPATATDKQNVARDIQAAMCHDLDTPQALKIIETYLSSVELSGDVSQLGDTINCIDRLFGFSITSQTDDITDQQKTSLKLRNKARENKDWQQADALRHELEQSGIAINDEPGTSYWHYL